MCAPNRVSLFFRGTRPLASRARFARTWLANVEIHACTCYLALCGRHRPPPGQGRQWVHRGHWISRHIDRHHIFFSTMGHSKSPNLKAARRAPAVQIAASRLQPNLEETWRGFLLVLHGPLCPPAARDAGGAAELKSGCAAPSLAARSAARREMVVVMMWTSDMRVEPPAWA